MKIRVGGKYRTKEEIHPNYTHILIIAKESEFGLSTRNTRSYYQDKYGHDGIALYAGIVIYENSHGLDRMPDLLTWGEDGSWDGAFIDDGNAIISEVIE